MDDAKGDLGGMIEKLMGDPQVMELVKKMKEGDANAGGERNGRRRGYRSDGRVGRRIRRSRLDPRRARTASEDRGARVGGYREQKQTALGAQAVRERRAARYDRQGDVDLEAHLAPRRRERKILTCGGRGERCTAEIRNGATGSPTRSARSRNTDGDRGPDGPTPAPPGDHAFPAPPPPAGKPRPHDDGPLRPLGDRSLRPLGDRSLRPLGDRGKIERLIESLGERLGTEEILILALILILSGSGGGECEDAGDVILLLALLLILG